MRSFHNEATAGFPPVARPRRPRAAHLVRFSILLVLAPVGRAAAASAAPEFSAPEAVTDTSRKYQLSRSSSSQLAADSAGVVHVTYGAGGFATSPGSPSFVYYRSRATDGTWSTEEILDNSEVGGSHVGGRHSSLALRPDGGVHVVWHDHRHCTAGGNWIDNIEIYADSKPPGGSFSTSDVRLTTSGAPHNGDSGYVPKIAHLPNGSLAVVWYDFFADGNLSDIYLKRSDTSGVFSTSESMASMRLTDLGARGGTPAFSLADLAAGSDGAIHLVWMAGFGAGSIYHGEVSPVGIFSGGSPVAGTSASYFDPPHLSAAPGGDVWIAWTEQTGSPRDIRLARRSPGGGTFGVPIPFHSVSAARHNPDLKATADGLVHLAWVDERSGEHVYYGVYDPGSGELLHETRVTVNPGNWTRPSLHLTPGGDVHLLWEQDTNFSSGRIWYASAIAPAAATPTPTALPTLIASATPTPLATTTPGFSPTPPPCCPGDADNSGGAVNANDFLAVQANFGADNGIGGPGDADCSGGAVNANDFLSVQANFGGACGP